MIEPRSSPTAPEALEARHCAALFGSTVPDIDYAAEAAHFASRLATDAQPLLAALCDNRRLTVTADLPAAQPLETWRTAAGSHALELCFASAPDGPPLVTSTALGALAAAFERLLGGNGEIDPDCASLPDFAAAFARRFEDTLVTLVQTACDDPAMVQTRSGAHGPGCAPSDDEARVWTLALTATFPGSDASWVIHVAVDEALLERLAHRRIAAPAGAGTFAGASLADSPLAEAHIPLRALLVDMTVPLLRIMQLEQGALLPVAVQRSVPLLAGDVVLAEGTVGECEERAALELTRTSFLPGTLS